MFASTFDMNIAALEQNFGVPYNPAYLPRGELVGFYAIYERITTIITFLFNFKIHLIL